MAERRSGISGLGVAMAASGLFLMYAGIRDVPLLTGIRELLSGKLPEGNPQHSIVVDWTVGKTAADAASIAGNIINAQNGPGPLIVQAARKYIGIPYHFGGAQNPQAGFDCSGLVNWVLGHDLGLTLPGQHAPGFIGATHGPVTGDYLLWGGAADIPRAQIQPGDLVCGAGHIGIATGGNMYIDAPTFGQTVHETTISWTLTPNVRRVKNQNQTIGGGLVKAQ